MAKLGMPSINVAFTEAGIEAIERSTRGIVMLLLEEQQNVIDKLLTDHENDKGEAVKAITNPATLYTVDNIPQELSDDNKDYITKALIGYQKAPYRVKIYLQALADEHSFKNAIVGVTRVGGDISSGKWADALKAIEPERWDYLAIPTIKPEDIEYVSAWVKTVRENRHKRIKAVLPKCNADYEGVINFTNDFIKTKDRQYSTAEYTARIAGLLAGTPQTISATYAPLPEVIDCDKYTVDENDEKVNAGEFFVFFDGTKYKMSRAMNSLVTTIQGKLEDYQTIKIIDIMDMIYDDIVTTAKDSYIGKYTNNYDNKCILITAIIGYLKELENGDLLQKGYSTLDINTDAVKTYQLSNGLYSEAELADMTEQKIKGLDTRKKVFLSGKIKILDAMEDFDIQLSI